MFCGSAVIILGMIIIATSSAIPQFIVGRFVLGIGIAIMTVAAPAYAVEISPPHWRGRCTGESAPNHSFLSPSPFGGRLTMRPVTFCRILQHWLVRGLDPGRRR